MKAVSLILLITFLVFQFPCSGHAQQLPTKNDTKNKVIVFGNSKIKITIDYNQKCNISCLEVNGEKVIEGSSGIFTEIKALNKTYSSLHLDSSPKVEVTNHTVKVKGINYGDEEMKISENWEFYITNNDIIFNMERTLPRSLNVDQASFPSFNFNSINTWEGAFLESGGLAWFYLFREKLFTYGVHSNYSAFWNNKTGNGLKVSTRSPGKQVASSYFRSTEDKLVYDITISDKEMIPRYDEDTHRRRFTRGKIDVWSGFEISKGKISQTITLSPFNYHKEYNRGKFVGIDGERVTSVLNTIARIGVIDAKHFGGNSWHTPYGPICLHEQYIGQLGIGINDEHYLNGYKQCLDFYRDNAIQPDGRVIARWAYENSDAMKGTVSPEGFYEAQWGYLMDSNPDFVTNVAELYDQCGDKKWVAGQQSACETALDYILKRDSNGNHLVEMMTNSETEKRGSDWLDIVWASFENALVNAKLYHALILWSDIEKQLGNTQKAVYYNDYAAQLKESFNKSSSQGGFWDEEKQCYIYWRDKDNSLHGNNLVTPVNFMAIAYGICDDKTRSKTILDQIEAQMQKENLFFWPCCMFSYQPGEAKGSQFPFPSYENGDIFLSWGSIAVEAYAEYNPELALKYVENVLARHSKDGLAFQRYGRVKQDGLGDDILSGNSLAVVGLYHAIFGINPLYNRLYLNPHIMDKLSGTRLLYNFRGEKLTIGLDKNLYAISNKQFKITSKTDFGFYSKGNELNFFNAKEDQYALKARTEKGKTLSLEIIGWESNKHIWNQSSTSGQTKVIYTICNLKPNSQYTLLVDGKKVNLIKSSPEGIVEFDIMTNINKQKISLNCQII
jgi:hypothetical protein